ncbi:MAG TPA: D-alanyl-D-alanine carboxypeptidase/D-alanyl-D-alanine-endopeptidase [Taishania sp.]|nr:D-alanyl-D-alanine carboxypeptidase/D-alanyl-D-alanine-endopeptidase [Taishania sp.]
MKIFIQQWSSVLMTLVMLIPNLLAQQTAGIQQVINYSGFDKASISLFAMDVKTNEIIYDFQGLKLLAPASTVKLFSTAYALDVLGKDYKPTTKLYYQGNVKDSILNGDIWIVGGGDMSLGSKYFSTDNKDAFLHQWAQKVKASGIKEIHGNIYVDASDFGYEGAPDGWLWEDVGNYYGAAFTGAMIYDNILEYHFQTAKAGSRAQLKYTVPPIDSLTFQNQVLSSTRNGDNCYIYGATYTYNKEGRGTLPQYSSDFIVKGSMPDPEVMLASEFQRVLRENHVQLKGIATSTRLATVKRPQNTWKPLFEHQGATIGELIKATNYESINVFAEGLMRLPVYEEGVQATTTTAAEHMGNYWKTKLELTDLFLTDGSGLSRSNAVSALAFCRLLTYMQQATDAPIYFESLPISGESGTLKNVAKNQAASGKIHAKSGTMKRVKSYAGYAETQSGRRIAFAFILNNYTCTSKQATQQLEILMNELVGM